MSAQGWESENTVTVWKREVGGGDLNGGQDVKGTRTEEQQDEEIFQENHMTVM